MQTSQFSFSINREHFGRSAIYFKRHSILVDESSISVKGNVVRMPSRCFDKSRKVWFEDTIHVSNKTFLKALYDYACSHGVVTRIPNQISILLV
ncbi:MAG: hypothetical protein CBB95_17765 [Alteromonas sp. TMED35]|jgi:hypothetical protein|uniref:hypothetical protein n=1 Tax=uncultured Alteromonas sp. TaxID=179113 RepID=UPI000B6D9D5A|nr:MAG: hypothetical protein CBB95_17765 [Alteromonas sp. TMED35]|tara:strand:+ start:52681 stop:52962 length:282 start_codon:yes stop_codon:yes gene_type:complete